MQNSLRLQAFPVIFAALAFALLPGTLATADEDGLTEMLPTGKRVTPLAAPGADLQGLNPGLLQFPGYLAGQAISTAISPDRQTLLVLTSGYNRLNGPDGKVIPAASAEYVFVYDATGRTPALHQVLKVPNTFAGIAFSPDGKHFYVSGGVDDDVHFFSIDKGLWHESGDPVKLNHASGLGLTPGKEPLASAGVAVTADGRLLLVANTYNDSVSVIDATARKLRGELDLRPGKNNPGQKGVPGGEYPFWIVAKGSNDAYVSSLRDREIVRVQISPTLKISARTKLAGNPNKMTLNRSGSKLFVACDNTDTVAVIDTVSDRVIENIDTTAPASLFPAGQRFTGSGPNDVALSNDERTLYVSNGGTNSVAVVQLGAPSKVAGLIPTGWYPNAVSVSADNRKLFVVNSKTAPGPNPELHLGIAKNGGSRPGPAVKVKSINQYVYQLEKAGLLTIPVPDSAALAHLTSVVAQNNTFNLKPDPHDNAVMSALHTRVKHVIYIIKENRTYDQVLGDLGKGNGDPSLTEFGEKITPNFHAIARQFVDLDNFFNSGEVSGDGWPWSTSGRESDFGQKAVPLNYSNRGTNYEYEGPNRDINVGLATVKERKGANPKTPDDPDLLPGAINVAEPDGPKGSPRGKGYIWDAVLRAGLSFREYGCMSDTALDSPRDPQPYKNHVIMSRPANPELYKFGDPYYRGFDPGYPDFFREAEWEREFDNYVAHRNLPSFEIVQLPVDHMGDFKTAIAGVNTPETQQADNDYGTGRLIDRVAHSPYRDSTLIFIVEDDAQDGPDHVDAHRSTAYVVGPYVKHGAVVSSYYTTVSVLRTMEDILGLEHLNLNTATTRPMTEIFDLNQKVWTFTATPSAILLKTQLPLSDEARRSALYLPAFQPAHSSRYWAARTAGFDFSAEDRINAQAFNRIIWSGLMPGPYPARP